MTNALKAPYEQIQANNEEPFEIGDDIIDPAKVVRMEIENAISVVANLITCKILIVEEAEVTPGDGYNKIDKALNRYNTLFAKKEGILKENLDEMETDQMKMFEEKITEDNG